MWPLTDLSPVTAKHRNINALREILDLAAQIQEAKLGNPTAPSPLTPTFPLHDIRLTRRLTIGSPEAANPGRTARVDAFLQGGLQIVFAPLEVAIAIGPSMSNYSAWPYYGYASMSLIEALRTNVNPPEMVECVPRCGFGICGSKPGPAGCCKRNLQFG